MKIKVTVDNQTFEVEVGDINARPVTAVVDGETFEVWPEEAVVEAPQSKAVATPVTTPSATPRPTPVTPTAQPVAAGAGSVNAPLPGVIISIAVKPGQDVKVGQELLVLEAMKMKNIIRATRAGKIANVIVNVGDHVKHGQPLLDYAG